MGRLPRAVMDLDVAYVRATTASAAIGERIDQFGRSSPIGLYALLGRLLVHSDVAPNMH